MNKLLQLHEHSDIVTQNNREIWINSAHIVKVRELSSGCTQITLSAGHLQEVKVTDSPKEIVRQVNTEFA